MTLTIDFIQIAILLLTGLAMYFLTSRYKLHKRLGGCIGTLAQCFWIYETFVEAQWGMFLLSGWFLYIYLMAALGRR